MKDDCQCRGFASVPSCVFFKNLVGAIASKEIMCPHQSIPVVISVSRACRFGVVRVMLGIPKTIISRSFRTLSEIFSLFLGADVSDDYDNGVPAN